MADNELELLEDAEMVLLGDEAAVAGPDDPVVDEANSLIVKILKYSPNFPARLLNKLASALEDAEARFQRCPGIHKSRESYTIGKLLSMIRDNEVFYELMCSGAFLQGPVASVAAGFRVLYMCFSTWTYSFFSRQPVREMVKQVVMEELDRLCVPNPNKDTEALATFALGIFGCQLSRGDNTELLSSDVALKLMHYLRLWTLGESDKSSGHKGRDEIRIRSEKKSVFREGDSAAAVDEIGDEVFPEHKRRKVEGKNRSSFREDASDSIRDRSARTKVVDGVADGERSSRKEKNRIEAEQNEETYMAGTVDVSVFARRAIVAAQTEAKSADAPSEAIKAARDAAAELVKAAALEALANSKDEEGILAAAEAAANSVADAAASIVRKRKEEDKAEDGDDDEDDAAEEEDVYALDIEGLAFRKAQFCVQCLFVFGDYIDILAPVLQHKGVEVCVELLRRHSAYGDSVKDLAMVSDVLRLVRQLAGHRKFAALFVDLGGMQQVLSIPRVPQTQSGISLCLVGVTMLQGVMERVCTIYPPIVQDIVALAFELFDSYASTSGLLFLGTSFVFRGVVEAFENLDGLRKLLNFLRSTTGDKQLSFSICVALKQYFRAAFLIQVDSLRPVKNHRGVSRTSTSRVSYKPLDISNEATEEVIQQLFRDRKLATAFIRAKWPALDIFMNYSGHIILLELCLQAAADKSLIVGHALAILLLVTLMPFARKSVVSCSLSNGRPGMSVLLDAASGIHIEPEVIQYALLVLINLVCPPPALSSRSSAGLAPASGSTSQNPERQIRGDDNAEASTSAPPSALVGDARISLGPCSGGPGLAAFMEQGYRTAREAVRANNGIKVLLHLLLPRMVLPPPLHDCIRALTCRILLGLARDDAIAQILTKLQVGKLLSELLRDGSHANRQGGADHDRWQTELSQVALDLIGIVTNAGRANTVASEAAAPTLRRIERAAIAAATPINYHSRELLQLVHEHLLASGLTAAAAALLKEAQLTPLDSVSSLSHSCNDNAAEKKVEIQWPSGRLAAGLLFGSKHGNDEDRLITDNSAKKRARKIQDMSTITPARISNAEESSLKTPSVQRSLKRKASERDGFPLSPNARPPVSGASSVLSPQPRVKSISAAESIADPSTPVQQDALIALTLDEMDDESNLPLSTPGASNLLMEQKDLVKERSTLDSLVGEYLKHQHRQCPAPITTLPPLSLLHPHVCPEPSPALYAPYNISSRLGAREIFPPRGGLHGRRHDRHFIYSRFRQVRLIREEEESVLTCATFLRDSGFLATGCHDGCIQLFDTNTGNHLESIECHISPISSLQASPFQLSSDDGCGQVLLSSSLMETRLWNSSSLRSGAMATFSHAQGAQFSHAGTLVGAYKVESPNEVLLYDVNTYALKQVLSDFSLVTPAATSRSNVTSIVHFNPSDILVLWKGVMWDHRVPLAVHRFDQFTDYGGGGFHPAGNEVIINSEVWDLRTYKLLRSVPSLDQTVVTFNTSGDVIYAILRRPPDDVTLALQGKRTRHPLFSAFRTMDAVDYSDIATIQVDRCVMDLAAHHNDTQIAVLGMDTGESLESCIKFYEVGRRRPTDDDSDPDDGMDEDDEESDPEDADGPRLLPSSESSDDSSDSESDDVGVGLSDADTEDLGGGMLEFDIEADDERGGRISFSDDEDGSEDDDDENFLDF